MKFKIFFSSVQKEFKKERRALRDYIDPCFVTAYLRANCKSIFLWFYKLTTNGKSQ